MSAKINTLPTIGNTNGKIVADASRFGKADDDPAPQAQADAQPRKSPFQAKTAAQWSRDVMGQPIPKKLYGDFVIENEITCIFASTNVGKSIKAVQMAQAIASGESVEPFHTSGGGRKVLYIDFELSPRQWARRYALDDGVTFHTPFEFHPNFIRLQNDYAEPEAGQSMSEYYLEAITTAINEHGASVVIIDNITWITQKLEKSADAAPFMMGLTRMKRAKNLTLILLAHTPKRDQSRPIDINDLQGSAMIGNFIDAAFAIGRSQTDGSTRYLKQIKCRDGEIVCGAENVATCTLEKNGNFLGFTFRYYQEEREHLHQRSEAEANERDGKVLEMHKAGHSYREIAKQVGCSHTSAKRIVERSAASPLLIDNPAFEADDEDTPF